MYLIHRHILATFLRYFSKAMFVMLAITMAWDVVDQLDWLVDNHPSFSLVLRYIIFGIANHIDAVLPLSMLLATLFSVGMISRYGELVALHAAGWSLLRTMLPLVIMAILATMLSLVWREFVIPEANLLQSQIREEVDHKATEQQNLSIRQLRKRVELTRRAGGDPTTDLVDIQFNMAFPLVNLFAVLMGIVLASGPRKITVFSGFGWALLVMYGYHIVMGFSRSLGHNGALPPFIAGWSGNVIYASIFMVLLRRARR